MGLSGGGSPMGIQKHGPHVFPRWAMDSGVSRAGRSTEFCHQKGLEREGMDGGESLLLGSHASLYSSLVRGLWRATEAASSWPLGHTTADGCTKPGGMF